MSSRFQNWQGAALITGASEGIGLEIARQLAARRMDLMLVSRTEANLRLHAQKLAQDHGIRAEYVACDLSTSEGPAQLMEQLRDVDLVFDVLVNNAAFGIFGGFGAQGPAREGQLARLNVAAPLELTAYLLPGMKRRRRGYVLNVASTAGFRPVPWIPSYAASKSFLIEWTVALDTELKGTGVHVAVLCPGTTATNFHSVSKAPAGGAGVFGQQTAAQVAAECMKGIDRGHRIIVTGLLNKVHRALAAFIPRMVASEIAYRALRPKSG
ncbi:MAG TPA: SDR family oxidoreductase [bacterium]|nr:SDR family oxidoreductase [bacterium]